MSFASTGDCQPALQTTERSEKLRYFFAELRNCLHTLEVACSHPFSPGLKTTLCERIQAANKLIEKIRRLEEDGKCRGDLDKEIGRLARLTNAVYRAEQAASDSSSEDGGEKDGFIASWESDSYEAQLHLDILQERDAKITHVTTAISQVNSLFKDISLLVNEQGEALDRIEDFLGNSAASSKKAVEELGKAEKRIVENRCRQCWLVSLAVLMLLVTSLTMTLYWQHKKQQEALSS